MLPKINGIAKLMFIYDIFCKKWLQYIKESYTKYIFHNINIVFKFLNSYLVHANINYFITKKKFLVIFFQ